ncbi:helix-turn-helix domain-containing protein [Mucilaginibacter sp. FT3.2]|uniref:helix-turn-helix domain-containing protein n=1 Tax=Mucilaginibacter sp. FT3.2 TaxID=2723090 RepID=UPI001609F116|nr:helix-turn-helix domain-containing protein [Mucilaginibacter sp. FT3.2]MBB6231383.1 AraC-like DNA-binding protein [Mucilaginibacter sp. FT3.2]
MIKKAANPFFELVMEQELKDSFAVYCHNQNLFNAQPVCRATYNRIFLINSGHGSLQIDDVAYPVTGNELFLLAKGQFYNFSPQSLITGYELSFGDCFWEKAPGSASNCKAVLFNNAAANQHIKIDGTSSAELNPLFDALHHEFIKADYINKPDALAAYLKIVMIKIANINAALADGFDSFEKQLYRRFIELVSNQYQNTHEVAGFAAQLGITARKLTDLCKRCSGKGAKDIINGQLIAEAKRLLQFSSKPVKEIAFHLHFSTPEQFSHFFKNNTYLSPNEYRGRFAYIGM